MNISRSLAENISRVSSKLKPGALFLLLPLFFGVFMQAQEPSSGFMKLNPPGSTYAFAFGLNNTGTIVGSFTDAKGVYKGFAFKGAKYTTIVFPGAQSFTQANGVNDSNTIVGDFTDKAGITHGFLLKDGKFSRLDAKSGFSTYISGINKAGNLVGYIDNNGNSKGFVKIGGKIKTFTFMGNATYAFGINSAENSVGYFIPPPFIASHGFFRAANGQMTQLDFPGSISTNCLGINDAGVITGFYLDSNNVAHGFTHKNGQFLSYSLPDIAGMNVARTYVGSYTAKDGKNYGYVQKP